MSLQQIFDSNVSRDYDLAAVPAVNIDMTECKKEEQPRMIALVNRLAKSDAGRETLEIAAKAGYKFGFLDAATNCFGCCFGGDDVRLAWIVACRHDKIGRADCGRGV